MTKSVYFSNQVLYPVDFLDPVALFPLNAQNCTKEINDRVAQGLPGEDLTEQLAALSNFSEIQPATSNFLTALGDRWMFVTQ